MRLIKFILPLGAGILAGRVEDEALTEAIEYSSDGRFCVNGREELFTEPPPHSTVEDEAPEQEARKTEPTDWEAEQLRRRVENARAIRLMADKQPMILKKILYAAIVASGLSLIFLMLKSLVVSAQACCSRTRRVDDMLSLSRGVVGLVYTALIGATGYPPDYPRLFHPEGFCFFIHMAGVFIVMLTIMEGINMYTVVSGWSANRWRSEGFWVKWVVAVVTLAISLACLLITWAIFQKRHVEQWSALGAFETWNSFGPGVMGMYIVLGCVAFAINLAAAVKFRSTGWEALERFAEDPEHYQELVELVRTRWIAGPLFIFIAGNFAVAVYAFDAQTLDAGLFSLAFSGVGGAVGLINLVYSIQLYRKVYRALAKVAGFVIAAVARR